MPSLRVYRRQPFFFFTAAMEVEDMARTALSTKQFISILQNLALDLPCHTEELRSLDAIIGDGDLGVTINLICKALQDYLIAPETEDMGKLLIGAGMRINKANPSTFALYSQWEL
jgi:dihydroxyacetone kinase-like protein